MRGNLNLFILLVRDETNNEIPTTKSIIFQIVLPKAILIKVETISPSNIEIQFILSILFLGRIS
jgi:hypothetical protein